MKTCRGLTTRGVRLSSNYSFALHYTSSVSDGLETTAWMWCTQYTSVIDRLQDDDDDEDRTCRSHKRSSSSRLLLLLLPLHGMGRPINYVHNTSIEIQLFRAQVQSRTDSLSEKRQFARQHFFFTIPSLSRYYGHCSHKRHYPVPRVTIAISDGQCNKVVSTTTHNCMLGLEMLLQSLTDASEFR
jgi:hypothetical protein